MNTEDGIKQYGELSDAVDPEGLKGEKIAEKVIKQAMDAGIPIHEDPELVALLMQLDLDKNTPDIMFKTLGEFLTWVKMIKDL